jgi:hypothetical protein
MGIGRMVERAGEAAGLVLARWPEKMKGPRPGH